MQESGTSESSVVAGAGNAVIGAVLVRYGHHVANSSQETKQSCNWKSKIMNRDRLGSNYSI